MMITRLVVVVSVILGIRPAEAALSPSMVMSSQLVITNPVGEAGAAFGSAIAPLGKDRAIVGAPRSDVGATDAGVVYLHGMNTAVLATITNPAPQADDRFGFAVAAVGRDYILASAYQSDIGATNAGVAYLFSTNGNLLLTFTNPAPVAGDLFGYAVGSVGGLVAISAAGKDSAEGTNDAGVVYLFETNGALVTTIRNPSPQAGDLFGQALAPMGTDRLLIGAPQKDRWPGYSTGVAYLYGTNGALLNEFLSPGVGELGVGNGEFGASLCAVGTDFVLIGAPKEGFFAATDTGFAYLMTTNGTMVSHFVSSLSSNDRLGATVAAGTDGMLFISAPGRGAGTVFVGNTNGMWIASASGNLTTAGSFGYALAVVGDEQVWVTSIQSFVAPNNAGRAFLYRVAPSLDVNRTTTNIVVSWSAYASGYRLEQSTNSIAGLWVEVTEASQRTGEVRSVTIPMASSSATFYRLAK